MHLLKGVLGACGPLAHVSVPSFYFFSLFELQITHPTVISFYLIRRWLLGPWPSYGGEGLLPKGQSLCLEEVLETTGH